MNVFPNPFYILEIICSWFIIKSLKSMLVIKKGIFKRILLFLSCYLLTVMIIFIGDFGNILPTILFFLFCIFTCFEGTPIQKLTIGLIFACTSFSLNAIHDNFIWQHDKFSFIRMLFWGLFYLYLKNNAPDKYHELSPSLWKLLFVLTLTPIGIVLSIVLLSVTFITSGLYTTDTALINDSNNIFVYSEAFGGNTLANLALLIIALFSFIGLLRTITVLSKYQKLQQETALISFNQKYYEAMEQQHFEIRRLKHDLNNHLQMLYSLPPKEQNEYLKQLIENTAFTTTLNYSGDTTVNAVLSVKESLIRQNNIDFILHASIPNELPIEKVDICAIFANALDNAIEACLNLPAEKRKIILETSSQKGLFLLKVKNPTINSPESVKELPKTTKKDKINHGYGLKSINEIVKRYNGSLETTVEDGMFSIFLYFPY